MSGGLDPDPHPDPSLFKIAIETLGLSIVVQSPLTSLARLGIDGRYLLHARVISHAGRPEGQIKEPTTFPPCHLKLTRPDNVALAADRDRLTHDAGQARTKFSTTEASKRQR
jgi:hypothetical protein